MHLEAFGVFISGSHRFSPEVYGLSGFRCLPGFIVSDVRSRLFIGISVYTESCLLLQYINATVSFLRFYTASSSKAFLHCYSFELYQIYFENFSVYTLNSFINCVWSKAAVLYWIPLNFLVRVSFSLFILADGSQSILILLFVFELGYFFLIKCMPM